VRALLNKTSVPDFDAVARTGIGVFDTLKAVAKLVLTELRKGRLSLFRSMRPRSPEGSPGKGLWIAEGNSLCLAVDAASTSLVLRLELGAITTSLGTVCFARLLGEHDIHGEGAYDERSLVHEFRFEAAHRLPRVPEGHKCARLHGHSYRIEVCVRGPSMKTPDGSWIFSAYSTRGLLCTRRSTIDTLMISRLSNPTSELLARWIWERMSSPLPELARSSCTKHARRAANLTGTRKTSKRTTERRSKLGVRAERPIGMKWSAGLDKRCNLSVAVTLRNHVMAWLRRS